MDSKDKKRAPYDFNRSRRQFATQLAQTASFLALAMGKGSKLARAAQAAVANPDPRYLINIHTRGGSDAAWFHAYFPPTDLVASGFKPTPTNATTNYAGNGFGPQFTDRFPVSMATPHPNNSNYLMGLGMSIFSPSDYQNMAIWRGILPDGSHDIGNRIINCGQFSNYAAGFSSLISLALAQQSAPLPLHYAESDVSQAALYTWPGLLNGYAIPVNLPWFSATQNAFANLTGSLAAEISPASSLAATNATTAAIAAATVSSGFRLSASQSFYQSFVSSFQGMNQVYNTGMGTSAGFINTVAAYQNAAISVIQSFMSANGGILTTSTPYGGIFAGYFNSMDSDISNLYGMSLQGLPSTWGGLTAGQQNSVLGLQIAQAAYCFGLAEYLITNNLTRVIDIGPLCLEHDGHFDNGTEFASMIVKYAMLQALMRRLGNPAITGTVPGTQAHNYMQHATIVMSTEFDRQPVNDVEAAGAYPGTNHGSSASVIMAGRGVNVGKVFGDVMTAPPGYGRYSWAPNIPGAGAGYPVPVDLTTGQPSASGVMVSTKCIFNTVLAIFGVTVPPEQINGGVTFTPIIAKS